MRVFSSFLATPLLLSQSLEGQYTLTKMEAVGDEEKSGPQKVYRPIYTVVLKSQVYWENVVCF